MLALIEPVIMDFDMSIMKFPNIKRSPGGASTDLIPNLQLLITRSYPEGPTAARTWAAAADGGG